MVTHFLIWARNYEEIVGWEKIATTGRKWKITLDRVYTADGDLITFMRPKPEQVVPQEIVLTSREALLFGYGCAVAGMQRSRTAWTQEDWKAQAERKKAQWEADAPEREAARQRREEERQERMRAYAERKARERGERTLGKGDSD